MSGNSFVFVVFGLVPLGFLIWGLITQTIVGPGGWIFKKAKDPIYYWISVLFNIVIAAICFYMAARSY